MQLTWAYWALTRGGHDTQVLEAVHLSDPAPHHLYRSGVSAGAGLQFYLGLNQSVIR